MNDFAPGHGLLRLPEQVSFGAGALASLAGEAKRLGERVLVCVDPFIASTAAFDRSLDELHTTGLEVFVHSEIAPELPSTEVEQHAGDVRGFAPDLVIGLGGGSALDLAKLLALLLAHPLPLARYYGENNVPGPTLPVIAVPTTAGTGSEVTPVAVVSDPERELKVGVSSRYLIPRIAIVDPTLTLGAPAAVTAHAGIDALVHAIEAYTAATREPEWANELPVFVGRNSLSSVLALEAIRLIGANLPTAVAQPDDLPPHHAMAHGSLLAGMAFGSAGTHLSHALQYPIGAASKTPHGLGTGLLLPYVLEACRSATEPELARIGAALGAKGDEQFCADATISVLHAMTAAIGLPANLGEIGIEAEQLPRIAELARGVTRLAMNAPIEPEFDTLMSILTSAHSGVSSPSDP